MAKGKEVTADKSRPEKVTDSPGTLIKTNGSNPGGSREVPRPRETERPQPTEAEAANC